MHPLWRQVTINKQFAVTLPELANRAVGTLRMGSASDFIDIQWWISLMNCRWSKILADPDAVDGGDGGGGGGAGHEEFRPRRGYWNMSVKSTVTVVFD